MIKEAISSLIAGKSMTQGEAAEVMEEIMSGQATPSQIAAFLVALRIKGETVDEISGMARVMRSKATKVTVPGSVTDVVGTGGDGANTFNISTAAALVAAGAAGDGPVAACVAGCPACAPVPAGVSLFAGAVVRCSSIFCILSIADLSARGNTPSTFPSLVPNLSWPHFSSLSLNLWMSPSPSCVHIFAVDSGRTGCARAVTMRNASAHV